MDARPAHRLRIDVDFLRPDTFSHRSQSEDYPLTRDYVHALERELEQHAEEKRPDIKDPVEYCKLKASSSPQ